MKARPVAQACAGAAMVLGVCNVMSDTIALWLFDDDARVGGPVGAVLRDAGPHGHDLVLGTGARMAAGKFGEALWPGAAAGAHRRGGVGSKLNLGADDWTIECWLRLDATGVDEGAIFEIGSERRGNGELVTRLSVLPQENAFVFAGLATASSAAENVSQPVESPTPDGPAAEGAVLLRATLAIDRVRLPRETWFHVALVHTAAAEELRVFLDGKSCAVARASPRALPHAREGYIAIGCDGAGGRALAGAIDELRISDGARYVAEFTPPASLAQKRQP